MARTAHPGPRRTAVAAAATATVAALLGPVAPAAADTQVFRDQQFRVVVTVDSTVERPFGGDCIRNQRVSAFVDEDTTLVSYSDYSECDGDGRLIYGGGASGPTDGVVVDVHPHLRSARLRATFPVADEFAGIEVGTATVDLRLDGVGKVERTTRRSTNEQPGEGGAVQVTTVRTTEKTRAATVDGAIRTDYVDWPTLTGTTTAQMRSETRHQVIRTSAPDG